MESQYSEFCNDLTRVLHNLIEGSETSSRECRNLWWEIERFRMSVKFTVSENIRKILQHCNEYVMQQLWFNVFKNCQIHDVLKIFQDEIINRGFCANLWCQEVFCHSTFAVTNEDLAGPSGAPTCAYIYIIFLIYVSKYFIKKYFH